MVKIEVIVITVGLYEAVGGNEVTSFRRVACKQTKEWEEWEE